MSRFMPVAGLVALLLWMHPATVPAAEFVWHDVSGKDFSLADYRGKPVALHFWASWCPPCRSELPELDAWLKANPDVHVIPISLDHDSEAATRFLQSQELALAAFTGNPEKAMILGVRGLPSTLILDASGRIRNNYTGPLPWRRTAFSNSLLEKLNPGQE